MGKGSYNKVASTTASAEKLVWYITVKYSLLNRTIQQQKTLMFSKNIAERDKIIHALVNQLIRIFTSQLSNSTKITVSKSYKE